ncbi:MAG: AmmeMemoRadiSam system protein B [Deltaproteobacteria bacterium]|nr:AmmeMemoRadiSam system protein B [Deltaproteobacteria bacterium]
MRLLIALPLIFWPLFNYWEPVTAKLKGRVELFSPYEKIVERAIFNASQGPPSLAKSQKIFVGGLSPHHDLALPMIVRFFQTLSANSKDNIKRVWLLAPDHFGQVRGLAQVCPAPWRLSHRRVEADSEAVKVLKESQLAESEAKIFSREHGVTLHIPLIGHFFPKSTVVPILLNQKIPNLGILAIKNKIRELFSTQDLLILSMDLSHYKNPQSLALEDQKTLKVLTELNFGQTGKLDVDARHAANLTLRLFKDLGATKTQVLERRDCSYFLERRVESGVSYATVVYEKEPK